MRSSPNKRPAVRNSSKLQTAGPRPVGEVNGNRHEPAISRHRLLFSAAIAVAMGTTGYYLLKKPDPTQNDRVTEVKETYRGNEIILGNVRLFLNNPDKVSPAEKEVLFRKMRSAYGKLVDYLGEDVMIFPDRRDLPVLYDANAPCDKSGVTWDVKLARVNADGSTILKNPPQLDSLKINASEKVIAHEFVHLFAQSATGGVSLAFAEGHAHAIEKLLYGIDSSDRGYYADAAVPVIGRLLDIGMDFTEIDVVLLKGGGSYDDLNPIVRRRWANAWSILMKEDPSFMKNFYGEIAKLKKQGVIDFPKRKYLEIANRVSPHFAKWYRETKCMKEIGETGSESLREAVKLPDNRLLIVNFQPVPRTSRGGQPVPPILEMPVAGKGRIEYADPGGAVRSYDLSRENYLFEIVTLPDWVYNGSHLKVTVGGIEIPFRAK